MKLKQLLYEILFVPHMNEPGKITKPKKSDKLGSINLKKIKDNEYVKTAEETTYSNSYYDNDNMVKIVLNNGKTLRLTYANNKTTNGRGDLYIVDYIHGNKIRKIPGAFSMTSKIDDVINLINKIGKRK